MKRICVCLLLICLLGIQIMSSPVVAAVSEVEVKYRTINDWKYGFTGKITIKNNSSKEIDQWKLEFDWDREIAYIWNAKIEGSENDHYVISSASWNKVIPPGGKISFGFIGKPGKVKSKPENFIVTDIYDQLDSLDLQWQQYYGMKVGEEFQKSYAHGVAYLHTRFPSDQPYRIGYEIIEKNPVRDFIKTRYQNVKFKTKDGLTLKGLFFPVKKAKGTVIMLHGYGSTAIWETDKLEFLLKNGYQIFSYNARYWNYYKTPERYIEKMENQVNDVECAVEYLKTRRDVDENKIAIYGFSYGASTAELFTPFTNDIKAVIFDGGSTSIPTFSPDITWEMIANDVVRIKDELYGEDPNAFSVDLLPSPYLNAMKKMENPSLFIHGINDSIPVSEVEALYNAVSGPKEMHIFPNSGHCDAMYTQDKADYEKAVLKFLKKYLK